MVQPPFQLNLKILNLVAEIQRLCGELRGLAVTKPSVQLRKENRIRTIHHSLAIEGNSLNEEQITAILEKKRVLGPKAQILEVSNALNLYDQIEDFNPLQEKDLLKAHRILMKDLTLGAGRYRTTQVGVFKGSKVSHVAPPAKRIPELMRNLFQFIQAKNELPWLIKACIFHYELEFIHPFIDGNGRVGRFWQQRLVMKQDPVFEYLSVESLIHQKQNQYYKVLELCDRIGDSTAFIEFSLENLAQSLREFQNSYRPARAKTSDRIEVAREHFGKKEFTRKDYMELHKSLSSATASRDLTAAVVTKSLNKTGTKALTKYAFKVPGKTRRPSDRR